MTLSARTLVGSRRSAWLAVLLLAALAVLPFVGRWERNRNAARQNDRMAAVYRLATGDGLVSKRLYAYRLAATFDCLDYYPPGRPKETNALELCFDPQGRLVETIDRRTNPPHFASLIEQPSLATLKVPPPRLLLAFAAAGAFSLDPRFEGLSPHMEELPVGFTDYGALHFTPREIRLGKP